MKLTDSNRHFKPDINSKYILETILTRLETIFKSGNRILENDKIFLKNNPKSIAMKISINSMTALQNRLEIEIEEIKYSLKNIDKLNLIHGMSLL